MMKKISRYRRHFHSLKLWFLEYAFIESAKEADLTHHKINITFLSRDILQVDRIE